uniref:TIL domain-containing protein n=1 Tax=Acrobeloides nanus TaxID=290746 RepID=A0A914E3E6_9BILA
MGTHSLSVSHNIGKKARCPSNEVFTDCICERTCGNQGSVCTRESQECQTGCHCQEGYVRHFNGVCILSDRCSRRSLVIRKLASVEETSVEESSESSESSSSSDDSDDST